MRWHLGPLPTTVLENVIGLAVLAYVGVLLTERRLPKLRSPYDIPIVLLLVAGVLGIAFAPDHTRAVGIYRAYFVEAIAVYYIAIDVVQTRRDLRVLLVGLLVAGLWMSIGQIVSFALTAAHHSIAVGAAPAFLNTSANSVALFLEPPLAFATGLLLFDDDRRARWISAAGAALILVAMLTTLSRGAVVAMAVLVAIAVASLPSWRARFATTAVALAAVILFLSIPLIRARIATVQFSILLRDSLYQQAFHVLAQRPIFGAGISGYPVRAAPFRPPKQTVELYPHNLWLTTWSELGLLGLIAFAVIFFGLLWRGIRSIGQSEGFPRAVIWGAVGALALYLVHGLVDSPYWKNDLSVEFWLIAALQVTAIRIALAARSGHAGSDRTRPQLGQVSPVENPML